VVASPRSIGLVLVLPLIDFFAVLKLSKKTARRGRSSYAPIFLFPFPWRSCCNHRIFFLVASSRNPPLRIPWVFVFTFPLFSAFPAEVLRELSRYLCLAGLLKNSHSFLLLFFFFVCSRGFPFQDEPPHFFKHRRRFFRGPLFSFSTPLLSSRSFFFW